MKNVEAKYTELQNRLTVLSDADKRFALAFSGGIDSRFIAYTALRMGLHPLLINVAGPHISAEEKAFARDWAQANSADFLRLESNPLENPQVAANDKQRCYYCKRTLFSRLKQEAQGLNLCDGTQAGDFKGYRPGIAALKELGVFSPLADSGLDKREIRLLAVKTGMDAAEQRARPCLLTRFDYFLQPNAEQLDRLDKAERAVDDVLRDWSESRSDAAMPDFRLRYLSPHIVELHLTPVDADRPDYLDEKLRTRLKNAADKQLAFPLNDVKITERLSGYFDRPE